MTNLAGRIDHTILKAEATAGDVLRLTEEARAHGFASVCVNGCYTSLVARALRDSGVLTCVVAGFPLGAGKATITAIEAVAAVKDGAQEIDFVAHVPDLLEMNLEKAKAHFLEVVRGARSANASVVVKVIVESAVLLKDVDDAAGEARIALACQAARESGCDFIKTSTGFHPAGGACVKAVSWMRKHAGGLYVKASGGIRTKDDAMRMLDAGADRLGCSASVAIVS